MNSQERIKKSGRRIWNKWSIAVKVLPLVILIGLVKFFVHKSGWESMELNALFTSLVAGTIFLIGFLISGVLADYKESEKIPSELTASIKTLFDDAYTIYKSKNSASAMQFIEFQKTFTNSLIDWFYKKERTKNILKSIGQMNDFFVEFDKEGVTANYIIKMKNEQHNIRRMVLRIETIRDTEFVGSAYAIVEAMGFLTTLGLILIRIEPFYASLFFTLLVSFLILYMFFLIKDLDDPFEYTENGERGTEIPLKPLHNLKLELNEFH